MHSIGLFVKFFNGIRSVTHVFLKDEDVVIFSCNSFVGEKIAIHLHDIGHFCVSVFHKLDFGIKMTGKAVKDFFLAQRIAIQVYFLDGFWPLFDQFH